MNGKLQIFAIFDQKAEAYMPPFSGPSVPWAIRTFGDMAKAPEHPVANHPEDYFLFHIGEMDEDTAAIRPFKVALGCALEKVNDEAEATIQRRIEKMG